jgi:hypothetical protein
VQNWKENGRPAAMAAVASMVLMLFGAANLRAAGQGGIGTLSLSPAQLSFGNVLIVSATGGGPSAPQTVTLTNTGSAALSVTTIVSSSHLFTETDTCRTSASGTSPSIAPGGTCTISVIFEPLQCGVVTATLTVTSDTAGNSPQTVSLSGTGTGPCVTLSGTTLSFASQLVTTTSTPQTVTLTSTGNQPVDISSLTTQGVFGETNNCSTAPLAPGASCTISVSFTPTQGGVTPGFVQINDNAGPIAQVISLSGTGADFALSSSPTSNTVNAGGSATYTMTVTSSGGFSEAVSLACEGPPPGVSCTFSPASVTPTGSTPATSTVTVATTASGFASPTRFRFPAEPAGVRILWWSLLAALIVSAAGVRLAGIRQGRTPNGRRLWRGAVVLAAGMLIALATFGCGGSSIVSTPTGTYRIQVNGSASAGTTEVTNPTLLLLFVQ